MNQSFNYGNFAVTGVLNPFSDNFLTDTTLNTNLWNKSVAISPGNVFVSHGHALMLTWSKPASGFTLQDAGQLNGAWANLTQGPNPILSGLFGQVVSSNELPVGNAAFFRLIKRSFNGLQVLLPGETAAPGTPTGKTGTPTAADTVNVVNVTVNAVDTNGWYIIPGVSDTIAITSSDGMAILPNNAALVNGTQTFQILFQTGVGGTQTVTATDTSATPDISATSSSVTVN